MLNSFEDDDCVTWINQTEVAEIFHSWLIFESHRDGGVFKSRLVVLKRVALKRTRNVKTKVKAGSSQTLLIKTLMSRIIDSMDLCCLKWLCSEVRAMRPAPPRNASSYRVLKICSRKPREKTRRTNWTRKFHILTSRERRGDQRNLKTAWNLCLQHIFV